MIIPNPIIDQTLRNAAIPFTLTMNEFPFMLMQDELKNQVELPLQRKREWSSHSLAFQSLIGNTLTMLNADRYLKYVMTLEIEANKVHISCSCAREVQTLCIHSYKALTDLMRFNGYVSFRKYRPLGMFDMATRHPEYFEKTDYLNTTNFRPIDKLANVYQLTEKPEGLDFNDLISFPSPEIPQFVGATMALTYIIMAPLRHKYLPFLSPSIGNLVKDLSEVRTFDHLLSGAHKDFQHLLTHDQKELNTVCHTMWQKAAKQSGSIIGRLPEQIPVLIDMFDYWQAAWPLLLDQKFVYLYHFYNDRVLKENPTKNNVWRIKPMKEKVVIEFQLKEKEAFYELHLKINIDGKPLQNFKVETEFFIRDERNLYLLPSLRDAALVGWMYTRRGHLTIFKEHFPEFEEKHLKLLRECYPVKEIKAAGRKTKS